MIAAGSPSPAVCWETAADALAELRSAGDEFEKFLLGRVDELDVVRTELETQRQTIDVDLQTLSAEHRELEREWQRLEEFHRTAQQAAQHVQNEARRLAKSQADLQAAQTEMAAQRAAQDDARAQLALQQAEFESRQRETNNEAEERLRQLQTELEAARYDQATLRAENAALSDRAAELDQVKSQLSAAHVELEVARQELARQAERLHRESDDSTAALRAQLASVETNNGNLARDLNEVREQLKRLTDAAVDTSRLRDQLAQVNAALAEARSDVIREQKRAAEAGDPRQSASQQRVHDLERENAALEAELEALRNRAAELAEHLSHGTRVMAEERAQWLGELRQLRRTVERSVQGQIERIVVGPDQSHPAATVHEAPAETAANDPVLDSVMAQFELLQRDLTRRRSSNAPAKAGR